MSSSTRSSASADLHVVLITPDVQRPAGPIEHDHGPASTRVREMVDGLASGLRDAGVQVSVLEASAPVDRQASRTLRDRILALHRTSPVHIVEWPDADGLLVDCTADIIPFVRLYGLRSHGACFDLATRAREVHTLSRSRHWIADSMRRVEMTRTVSGRVPSDISIIAPCVDATIWPVVGDNALPIEARRTCGVVVDRQLERAAWESITQSIAEQLPETSIEWVSADDRHVCAELLARAACVISLSDSIESIQCLMAAQRAGVPVIGALHGAARERIKHGHTGLLGDPSRPADIARHAVTLLRSEKLRRTMRDHALQRAAHEASPAAIAAQSIEAYRRALAEERSPESVTSRSGDARAQRDPERDGFALAAPHSRTGYGVVGAHLVRALQENGVPIAFHPIGPVNRTLTDNPALDDALAARTQLPPSVPSVRLSQQFDLQAHVGTGPRLGYSIFERDVFTDDERDHLRAQDHILVCTEWARDVCAQNGIDRPVHVVPLGVDRAVFHERVTPSFTSTDTVFMQVGKLEERKGQFELLCAFEEAFSPSDPVRLVLHCHNPFVDAAMFATLAAPFRTSPMRDRIEVRSNELASAREVAALMASADCGVFAVRAEGWNLEALEMLSMGKTVIATHVTGHTAFLSRSNARLITIDRLEPALGGALAGSWAAWDASQHQQLVAHLRAVHSARQAGALARNNAGIATACAFSWSATADALVSAVSSASA